tara:strand:+ start:380017 stop:381438 length:1422 start_codon:yes stop_codon:yes gene_type:complete
MQLKRTQRHRSNQVTAIVAVMLWSSISVQAQGTVSVQAQGTVDSSARPNVILILADDFALGDLAGGDGYPTRTPNLDRFAEQSVQFTQAYSASCVCAPARAALLTGRYPHRTGVVTLNMNTFPEMTRLKRDEQTIADLMSDAGYATGLIGKWHVGRGNGYNPNDRGFKEFEGFDGSQVLSYFDYQLDINGEPKKVNDKYLTDDLSDRAIQFVKRHRDHPFFLHLAHYAPHRPLEAPEEIVGKYRRQGFGKSNATIYAMIEVMDRGIGRLLDALSEIGLAENTIVIFASDNGPDPVTGRRYNGERRGTKYQVYEGGIQVPLFVRWPSQLQPGQRDQLVHFVDFLPTILDLCGIQTKSVNPIDGQSFASVLRDASAPFSRAQYWQWNRGTPNYTHNAAIRNGQYKLVLPFVTRNLDVKDSSLPPVLYDLAKDAQETTDIADEHPDLTQSMSESLRQWSDSIERDRSRTGNTGREQ